MKILRDLFGRYNHHNVTRVTLINDNGVEISCLTMGAIWQRFVVPKEDGEAINLLTHFGNVEDYYENNSNINKIVGRVADRIKDGKFTLDNVEYQLEANDGTNVLDGGANGFSNLNWNYTTAQSDNRLSVIFQRQAEEKRDGFPGDMIATVIYTLDNDNKVTVAMSGLASEKDTLFNPALKATFTTTADSELQVENESQLELDNALVPTGNMVASDAHSFAKVNELANSHVVYKLSDENVLQKVATLRDDSNQVEVQALSNGLVVEKTDSSVTLTAQMLPDAINHDDFGDIKLPAYGKRTYRVSFKYTALD